MKKYINKYLSGIAVMATLLVIACEKPEIVEFSFDGTTAALLETKLGGRGDVFYDAVVKAGYEDRLSGSTTFTYLVPTNDAMLVALETAGFSNVAEASVEFLQKLVEDHMFAGSILAGDLSKTRVTTLSGEMVYVSTAGGISFNAKAKVSGVVGSSNNVSTNGVVHIIDYPLINFPSASIAELVANAASADTLSEFTTLLAALQTADLVSVLANTDELYTVLAPTDAAFAAQGLNATNIVDVDIDVLTEILLYHVLPGRFFTVEFPNGRVYTANGNAEEGVQGISVTAAAGSLSVAGPVTATATTRNVLTTNGTVHIVDNVVLPRPYIIDAINNTPILGQVNLAAGVTSQGNSNFFMGAFRTILANSTIDLDSLYRSEVVFSIMAPDPRTSAFPPADTVILRQTFAGNLDLSTADGTKISSIGGHEYYVTEAVNGLNFVNGRSRVTVIQDWFNAPGNNGGIIQDFTTYNGLVTMVAVPFTPLPAQNALQVLAANPEFTTFAAILDSLGLGNLTDVTYLAVPNDVLDPIAAGFDFADEDDVADLLEVINGHIITTVFFANQLEAGVTFVDRNGNDVDMLVTIEAGTESAVGIRNEDDGVITVISFSATAGELDILASNGVVHAIEGVRTVE